MNINEQFIKYNLSEVESFGEVWEIDKIVCPHCGVQWDTDYDDTENAPFENEDWECPRCGAYFSVDCEPITSFHFTSRKYEED